MSERKVRSNEVTLSVVLGVVRNGASVDLVHLPRYFLIVQLLKVDDAPAYAKRRRPILFAPKKEISGEVSVAEPAFHVQPADDSEREDEVL